jgi:hypothetical protein
MGGRGWPGARGDRWPSLADKGLVAGGNLGEEAVGGDLRRRGVRGGAWVLRPVRGARPAVL